MLFKFYIFTVAINLLITPFFDRGFNRRNEREQKLVDTLSTPILSLLSILWMIWMLWVYYSIEDRFRPKISTIPRGKLPTSSR